MNVAKLNMHKNLSSVIAVVIMLFACQSKASNLLSDREVDLMNLIKQDCGSCHGMTMKGGLGPSLLPEQLIGRDDAELADIISNGVPGQPMPPWGVELSNEEILWIIQRLKEGLPP
jgi:cytochrome c55X